MPPPYSHPAWAAHGLAEPQPDPDGVRQQSNFYRYVEINHPFLKWPVKYRENAVVCREYVTMLDDVR
jgi:hypothetical protein